MRAGGTSIEEARGIDVVEGDIAYLTGWFWDTASFGAHTLTSSGYSDVFVAKLGSGTPVDEDLASDLSQVLRLHAAWPNPCRRGERVTIKTHIAAGEKGTLTVFNPRGQAIARHTLSPGILETSINTQELLSGIYIYQLRTGTYQEAKKLILIK